MSDFDGNDVNSWRTVLHKAAAALQQNPGDTEAKEWRDRALQNISDLEQIANEKDTREASDLGKGGAFALGAARGMSFGLGDLGQKYMDTPSEQQAVATTKSAHPGSTLLGTLAGGSVPFLLAPEASGGILAGASPAAVNTGLGAAQGFGLADGDLGDRAKGAVMGAALARFGPAAAKFAAKGVSGLAGRIAGMIPKAAAPAAEAASAVADPVASIPEEVAQRGDVRNAIQAFRAGKISADDLDAAVEYAQRDAPYRTSRVRSGDKPFAGGGPQPISEGPPGYNKLRPGESAQPIPGTEGRGIEVTGKRATPVPPTEPTILELQEGRIPKPSSDRNITAIRLRDGTILKDPTAAIHAQAIQNLGINPSDVAGGGFILPDGSYVEGSADAGPIGERAAAAERVRARRSARGFPRGPGGSVKWSTTQIGAPGLDLSSPASETQLKMLKQLSPEQLREALKNPFFAQLAKALGVQ